MASFRFNERARSPRATVGDVYLALSRDEGMQAKLGDIYETLFRRGGGRRGTEWGPEVPDHYFFVTPKKARAEITEVSTWIRERYGDPVRTPTEMTPFGYLGPGNGSYRYDGWVVFFAVLLHGQELDLAKYFTGDIAGMSWASHSSTMRTQSAATPPPAAPLPSLLQAPRERGKYAAPTSGRVWETPVPDKPGIFERITASVFGTKPAPTPAATLVPAPVVLPIIASEVAEEEVSAEDDAKLEAAFKAGAEAEARRRVLEDLRARRDASVTKKSLGGGMMGGQVGSMETRVGALGGDEDETEGARIKAALKRQQQDKEEKIRLQMQVEREAKEAEEAEAKLSTKDKLKRPEGVAGTFGG